MIYHRIRRGCCPECNAVLAYRRQRRHQALGDFVYCLATAILYVTAPLNPRAWKRGRR